jgi:hypothetical protein
VLERLLLRPVAILFAGGLLLFLSLFLLVFALFLLRSQWPRLALRLRFGFRWWSSFRRALG